MPKFKKKIEQPQTRQAVDPGEVDDMIHDAAKRGLRNVKIRERIGIVFFIVAIIAIILGVFGYMYIGHKFDVTASGIDQSMGALNDSAAIIFDGTASSKTVKKDSRVERILKRATNLISPEKDTDKSNSEPTINATRENVESIYKSKGATTCQIRIDDFSAYSEGEIFQRNGWNVGVLSITDAELNAALTAKANQLALEKAQSNSSQESSQSNVDKSPYSGKVKTVPAEVAALQKKVNNLRYNNSASMVVVVCSHQDVLELLDKVDVAIVNNVRDNIGEEGQYVGDVFVMPSPIQGSVGTIVSSRAKSFTGIVYDKIEVDAIESKN